MKTTFLVAAAIALLTGCGDDGNDASLRAQRLADKAAAAREEAIAATSVVPTEGPSDEAAGDTAGPPADEPPTSVVTTAPVVEPTGVIVEVVALDNTFRPDVVEITVGDEVLWENRGQNEHNVLHVETDDWGVATAQFQPGDVFTHVFTEPGEYHYYCSIHGSTTVGMVGTVIVTE